MSWTKRSLDSVQENFYLSWSEANETYCIKGSPVERMPLTDDFVDVRVSHMSTPVGQCIELLHNVRLRQSSNLQQIAVGNIIATSNNHSEFKIGDDVIVVLNSKWIKDKLRLPTTNVFKKPEFLTPEEAAVLPGNHSKDHVLLRPILLGLLGSVSMGLRQELILFTSKASN